jgi:hypothetical protein
MVTLVNLLTPCLLSSEMVVAALGPACSDGARGSFSPRVWSPVKTPLFPLEGTAGTHHESWGAMVLVRRNAVAEARILSAESAHGAKAQAAPSCAGADDDADRTAGNWSPWLP